MPRTRGGAGAPPGSITRSCQELADDRSAARRKTRRLTLGESAARPPISHRIWRAARRPPWSDEDRGAIGLRFSARHSLLSEGRKSKPRTRPASRRGRCMSSSHCHGRPRCRPSTNLCRLRENVDARVKPGHDENYVKTWMPGSSPGMTRGGGKEGEDTAYWIVRLRGR
jgi:hypothetical protein